jgi:uncharacterized protein YdeI (YjbR/CyaY-like superfamily)
MKIAKTLYVSNRRSWRAWLKRNYATRKEIWLIYYKKDSGKLRIPYEDAVEEALCFGWIDSTVKKFDAERYLQKFTPRNPGSIWAASNVRRVKKMIAAGKMTAAGRRLFDELKSGKARRAPTRKSMPVPQDVRAALEKNPTAYAYFARLAPSHRKMYIWWISDAKKEDTRRRRIQRVVEMCRQGRKPGML